MNQYEVMYVVDAALEDSARSELINRFNELVVKNGGEVERVDEWGKRRLAYAINYKTEGYYVLMSIKAPAAASPAARSASSAWIRSSTSTTRTWCACA